MKSAHILPLKRTINYMGQLGALTVFRNFPEGSDNSINRMWKNIRVVPGTMITRLIQH